MFQMNAALMVEDVLYGNVLVRISRAGLVDSVTGDIYISHDILRRDVLGRVCKIPYERQMEVIKKLLEANIIFINKSSSPACLPRTQTKGELFYCMKKEIAGKL